MKIGIQQRWSSFDPTEYTGSLKGKVALVTGGNGGIGFYVAKHLLLLECKVYIGGSNNQKTMEAVRELEKVGCGRAIPWVADLSRMSEVKRAAEAFIQAESRLDLLVNNAGSLYQYERTYSEDGLPYQFAVSHFGCFLLTKILLPCLKKTSEEYGSDVASEGHRRTPPIASISSPADLDIITENGFWAGMARYAISKQCNIWFTQELQRRLDAEGSDIIVIATHPGLVGTPGVDDRVREAVLRSNFLTAIYPLVYLLWNFIVKNTLLVHPETGSYSTFFAATSLKIRADPSRYKAAYITPHDQVTPLTGQPSSKELALQLWEMTERVLEVILKDGKWSK